MFFNRTNNKVNAKSTQKRRKTDTENIRKPVKRHRTARSPKRKENDRERIRESSRNANSRDHDKYKSNEDNRSVTIERRKSTSCRENYSKRMGKQKSVLNIDDNPDIEDRNDNDEKSEETSYEHDVNGENREMDAWLKSIIQPLKQRFSHFENRDLRTLFPHSHFTPIILLYNVFAKYIFEIYLKLYYCISKLYYCISICILSFAPLRLVTTR